MTLLCANSATPGKRAIVAPSRLQQELIMSEQHQPPATTSPLCKLSRSLILRILLVSLLGLLAALLLFPIKGIVQQRSNDQQAALQTIAHHWGERQVVIGPVLVVPYVEHFTNVDTVTDANGQSSVVSKDFYNDRTAILLPKNLEIRTDIKEEYQQQGMHNALLYNANISLTGQFDHAVLLGADEGERRIQWDKAYVMVGVSDTKALDIASSFFWKDERIALQPGTRLLSLLPNGFHAPLPAEENSAATHEFKLNLNLRGSDGLFFAPLGESSKVRMSSSWLYPNFQGSLLPGKQETSEQGFNAEWEIPHLVRDYPQYWILDGKQSYSLENFLIGVNFHEKSSLYPQILHLVPFGGVFIGLAFMLLLAAEQRIKRRLHLLHYGLVAMGLLAFFLILLALAEQIGFLYAYLVAATLTALTISIYTGSILRSRFSAFGMLLLLASLYAGLFWLREMTSYTLMAGVGLLTAVTFLMMIATRHLKAAD